MAEFEVYASLEGETDVEVFFKKMTHKERLMTILAAIFGRTVTLTNLYVALEGDTFVNIEPPERY